MLQVDVKYIVSILQTHNVGFHFWQCICCMYSNIIYCLSFVLNLTFKFTSPLMMFGCLWLYCISIYLLHWLEVLGLDLFLFVGLHHFYVYVILLKFQFYGCTKVMDMDTLIKYKVNWIDKNATPAEKVHLHHYFSWWCMIEFVSVLSSRNC